MAVLVTYIANIFYMSWFAKQNPSKDEKILTFKSLEFRFFTMWTFFLQIAYAFYSLVCDSLVLKNANKKNYKLDQPVTEFREIAFAGLVWPSTLVVFTIFWGIYTIDRALIFPEYMDTVIPNISNHVIHTFILPVVLFEVVFRPRIKPETHARNIAQLTLHLSVYLSVLLFTYQERGVWLYPILGELYGTLYFPLALAGAAFLFYVFYYIQWPLTSMIHASKDKKVKSQKADAKKKKNK